MVHMGSLASTPLTLILENITHKSPFSESIGTSMGRKEQVETFYDTAIEHWRFAHLGSLCGGLRCCGRFKLGQLLQIHPHINRPVRLPHHEVCIACSATAPKQTKHKGMPSAWQWHPSPDTAQTPIECEAVAPNT